MYYSCLLQLTINMLLEFMLSPIKLIIYVVVELKLFLVSVVPLREGLKDDNLGAPNFFKVLGAYFVCGKEAKWGLARVAATLPLFPSPPPNTTQIFVF